MSLSPNDHARLARILQQARELEETWPKGDRLTVRDLGQDPRYSKLRAEVKMCADATSESLRRLADSWTHFHDQVSLQHFYSFLVPFERLVGRGLRDDEFLVTEGDGRQHGLGRVPLKVIVENLRSSFNVGALFRTAECLGASEILLCGYTPGPDDEKTSRTAMGTADLVPWRRVDRAAAACQELRAQGYRIIALETAATAVSLDQFEFAGAPVAFVLGNERFGIDGETLRAVDTICRIPVRGVKNSLNVGVAFGIAGFEWLRQHSATPTSAGIRTP